MSAAVASRATHLARAALGLVEDLGLQLRRQQRVDRQHTDRRHLYMHVYAYIYMACTANNTCIYIDWQYAEGRHLVHVYTCGYCMHIPST